MNIEIELQPVSPPHAARAYEAWGCNPNNFTYLSARPQHSIQDTEQYLQDALAHGIAYHIVLSEAAKTIGLIKAKIDRHRALVGYVIDQQYWGRGIATAALQAFLPTLRECQDIQRIWATCSTQNPASAKVLEKCGFTLEGTLKNWIVYPAQGSQVHDNLCFCLSEGELHRL